MKFCLKIFTKRQLQAAVTALALLFVALSPSAMALKFANSPDRYLTQICGLAGMQDFAQQPVDGVNGKIKHKTQCPFCKLGDPPSLPSVTAPNTTPILASGAFVISPDVAHRGQRVLLAALSRGPPAYA